MSEGRLKILEMLEAGKITVQEAQMLLRAVPNERTHAQSPRPRVSPPQRRHGAHRHVGARERVPR